MQKYFVSLFLLRFAECCAQLRMHLVENNNNETGKKRKEENVWEKSKGWKMHGTLCRVSYNFIQCDKWMCRRNGKENRKRWNFYHNITSSKRTTLCKTICHTTLYSIINFRHDCWLHHWNSSSKRSKSDQKQGAHRTQTHTHSSIIF